MNVRAMKNFRRNLRTELEDRGISQRDLADLAGISYPYVNRILQDKADPSVPICEQIAGALGLTLIDLLTNPRDRVLSSVSR